MEQYGQGDCEGHSRLIVETPLSSDTTVSQKKSAFCSRISKMIARIITTERLVPEEAVAVYLPDRIDLADLVMLSHLPQVSKIMLLPGSLPDDLVNEKKILIVDDKHWTLSKSIQSGHCLLVVGKLESIRFRTLLAIYLAGYRKLYFAGRDRQIITHNHMIKLLMKRVSSASFYHLKSIIKKGLMFLFGRSVMRQLGEKYYRREIQKLLSYYSTPILQPEDFNERKVHYFIGSLRPGGAERQLANTVSGVHADKRDVVVTCQYYDTDEDRFYGSQLEAKGIAVNKLRTLEEYRMPADNSANDVAGHLNRWVKGKLTPFENTILPYVLALLESRPQIVHAWLDQVNVRAGLAALIVGVPKIILSQRNVAPDNFLLYTPEMRPGYQVLLDSLNVTMLNNSHAGAVDYGRWLGISPDQITVVHNGFNQIGLSVSDEETRAFRAKYQIPEGLPVMGGVLRFYEEKQPLFWLEIARKVLDQVPDAWFVLVGEGILLDRAKQLAAELKLSERTIFTNLMKHPLQAVKAMDVFVLSSRKEGLPNVLIEAQSIGVPVVTPDVGGAAEALWQGKTGYALKNATASDMADQVVKVLRDQEFRDAVKQIGPGFISEKFGLEMMIKNTLAVYDAE